MEKQSTGALPENFRAQGRLVHRINVLGNLFLSASKLSVGILFHSQSLIADGIHQAGDVLHTIVAWVAFHIAEKPADEDHPYGHGNAESVAGLAIGLILFVTGIFVSYGGIVSLLQEDYERQGWLALAVAVLSIGIKEALARYNFKIAEKLNSPVIVAVAQDHRSDAIASLGAVVGIGGSMLGFPFLDPIGAVFIGCWIIGISFPIVRKNLDVLMDAAPRGDIAEQIKNQFIHDSEVVRVDSMRIHPLGPYYEVDLEIAVDGGLSVREGHRIAHRVRDQIIEKVAHVREVKVHVNPSPEGDDEVRQK